MDILLSKGTSIFENNWIVERLHDSLIDNINNHVFAFINSLIINYFYVQQSFKVSIIIIYFS
jgi:hypothetical protein